VLACQPIRGSNPGESAASDPGTGEERGFPVAAEPKTALTIKPTDRALTPSTDTRNTGSRLWIISDDMSMNIETSPRLITPEGSWMRVTACWL
jgi:hypothetical protein